MLMHISTIPATHSPPRRSRLFGRARTTVLWSLAAFAVLQLGLAIAIEYRMPELRDPNYAIKAERLQKRWAEASRAARACDPPQQPKLVVMLGSSRTAFGLKAGELEEPLARELSCPVIAYNMGVFAAGPVTELVHLKRLVAEGIRPDVLLIEVLPPLLAGQYRVPSEAKWLPADKLWLRELPLLERHGFPAGELRDAWLEAWPVPWYSHRFAIISRIMPTAIPWNVRQDWSHGTDAWGWARSLHDHLTPKERCHLLERTHAEYAYYLEDFHLGGPTADALREMLEVCRQEGIPAALVLMPEGSDFRSWYPRDAWQQIAAYLEDLSRQYDTPIINCRQWIADGEFSDSHHLLFSGAVQFTRRLGRDAILPLLKAQKTSLATMAKRG